MAIEVIARRGPDSFTLADVARKARLSPSTLIQRFRTKERLLHLALEQSNRDLEAGRGEPLASRREGLAGLMDLASTLARNLRSDQMHQQVALLAKDLSHPRLRRLAEERMGITRGAIRGYLSQAVARKEIGDGLDLDALTEDLEAFLHGIAIQWAFRRDGPIEGWFEKRLRSFLGRFARGLPAAR